MDLVATFPEALNRFKHWAETRDPSAALYSPSEWECDYLHWDEIYEAVAEFFKSEIDPAMYDDILYTLARDNEDEVVLDMLAGHPALALQLAKHTLTSPELEARWQMAVVLGRIPGDESKALLIRYLDDPEEYVRRRAGHALDDRRGLLSPLRSAFRRLWTFCSKWGHGSGRGL